VKSVLNNDMSAVRKSKTQFFSLERGRLRVETSRDEQGRYGTPHRTPEFFAQVNVFEHVAEFGTAHKIISGIAEERPVRFARTRAIRSAEAPEAQSIALAIRFHSAPSPLYTDSTMFVNNDESRPLREYRIAGTRRSPIAFVINS
jgi:hypothetical protein